MAKSKKKLTAKQRKMLIRIIAAAVLLAAAAGVTHKLSLPVWAQVVIFLIPFTVAGYDVVRKAVLHIISGQMLDENLLMTIATIGAFALREYIEGAAVMLFYQVGELFQNVATTRSRKSVAELMDIRPDSAAVIRDGERLEVHPSEVGIGEVIEVRAGEKLPLDGVVLEGETELDTAALTGESLPRRVRPGDEVLSGCVNLSGTITLRTTKPFGESTVSKILALVENASSKKARSENFITRFARVYTPVVVGAAVLLALLLPVFTSMDFKESVTRALNFLVVSCPCALVISVPMSFFGGIGGASRQGVLIKGGSYMETLARADKVIFDKTGTLTKGRPEVKKLLTGGDSSHLIALAAAAEAESNHPIARSVVSYARAQSVEIPAASAHRELAGRGISCDLDGRELLAGNLLLMQENGVTGVTEDSSGTMVHVALGGEYIGCMVLGDSLKEGSRDTISALSDMKIASVILTGDSKAAGEAAAAELGVGEVHTELLPADKVRIAEEIISRGGGATAFVGDGINDAPVLSRADVGIAMGALGSDAAIEAADIVLMDDDPRGLVTAMRVSRRTIRIVRENIVFAIGVKLLVLATSALGFTNMWAAVFADVGVAVIAILNAMRALKKIKP